MVHKLAFFSMIVQKGVIFLDEKLNEIVNEIAKLNDKMDINSIAWYLNPTIVAGLIGLIGVVLSQYISYRLKRSEIISEKREKWLSESRVLLSDYLTTSEKIRTVYVEFKDEVNELFVEKDKYEAIQDLYKNIRRDQNKLSKAKEEKNDKELESIELLLKSNNKKYKLLCNQVYDELKVSFETDEYKIIYKDYKKEKRELVEKNNYQESLIKLHLPKNEQNEKFMELTKEINQAIDKMVMGRRMIDPLADRWAYGNLTKKRNNLIEFSRNYYKKEWEKIKIESRLIPFSFKKNKFRHTNTTNS